MGKETIKKEIVNHLLDIINRKLEIVKTAIESAKESRNSDTKSSAGDKYETGRAMMQMEMDKSEAQLTQLMKQKRDLLQINLSEKYEKVTFGSLVKSNQGNYFISIGQGKLEVNDKVYYAISLASPIGKLLHNKTVGEEIPFQGKEITIIDIL